MFYHINISMKPRLLISLFLVIALHSLQAQQTTVYTEADQAYKRGMDFFDKGIYTLAQQEFQNAITQLRPANEPESKLLRGRAELYYAKSAIRTSQPNSEQLILDFIRNYSPDPLATQAIFEMGNFYFNSGNYDKAGEFYSMLDDGSLTSAQKSEANFKKGYSFFVKKQFPKAKPCFAAVKEDLQSDYYLPANYYYGMTAFFENNFDESIKSFQRVASNKQYSASVPYYITQIYFAQHDYNKVISYGENALNDPKIKNSKELSQLVGQALFERKDYIGAAKYLEIGAEGNAKMRMEDYYQLGFCEHKLGRYADAAKNLENLSGENSVLGQNAMYLLGDSYLKSGDHNAARNAFASASRMNFDVSTQEDAQINYAKLSYELKYTQDAVNALEGIGQGTKYYNEAQTLLGDVLLQTRNYEEALTIIGNVANKTPKIREAYQKATLYRGIQLMQENNIAGAQSYFEKSLKEPMDVQSKAIAQYWLGDIASQNKNYDQSENYLNQFLTVAKTLRTLPDESSVYTGEYLQGYNYLKQKNYGSALGYFQSCVADIKRNQGNIYSDAVKNNILGDAVLRTGDCLFKRNKYDDAVRFYDEAVAKQYSGYVYALYQKGIIQGLRGNNVDKLVALEKIPDQFPNSEFAALALFEAGATYQQLNQLDKASNAFKRIITNYKKNTDLINPSLLRLGLVATNQGNQDQAIAYYKQIFSNTPSSSDAKAALERLQDIYVNELGKPDEYFAFVQSTGYSVDNVAKDSISFKAADTQYDQGNYDKAIIGYSNYLNKFPNGGSAVQAYYSRAESYASLKDFDRAFSDYYSVVQKGTGSKYYPKATEKAALIAYNSQKDFTRALDLYTRMEKSAATDDKRFEAELGAARSAYRINKVDAVYDMANKVMNSASATKEQVSEASFYLGKVAFDRKDYSNATPALTKAIATGKASEQTDEAEYLLSYIEYLNRDLDAALKRADKASQNSTSQLWAAKCVILEADIYAEKNDLFNARAALNAVIENFKDNPALVDEAKAKLQKLNGKVGTTKTTKIAKPGEADKNGLMEMEKN